MSTCSPTETSLPLPLRLAEIDHDDAERLAVRRAAQRIADGECYDEVAQVNCLADDAGPVLSGVGQTGSVGTSFSYVTGMQD